MKPTSKEITQQKRKLRKFIDDESQDALERRLAQLAEYAIRWATESTLSWNKPDIEAKEFAKIIRAEIEEFVPSLIVTELPSEIQSEVEKILKRRGFIESR